MCEIVDPQLPLAGYQDISQVVDLRQFMEQNCLTPDFGFDTVGLNPITALFQRPIESLQQICNRSKDSEHF